MCITTVNAEIPTAETVDAPDSCMGKTITNATKVKGRVQVFLRGEQQYDSGDYEKDVAGMTLKIHGNTSTVSPKKPFKIKLQKKADLLCRGDESFSDKEWVLNRATDKLNNFIGHMFCKFLRMEWTPSSRFVNVMLNDKYQGLYLLQENVKRNTKCRIDVDGDNGFLFEFDPYYWNEDYYIPTKLTSYKTLGWTFKYPEVEDLTDEQKVYMTSFLQDFEKEIMSGNYIDYIDVESFARWLLCQNLLGNSDGVGSNIFLKKYDRSSILQMPVIWDLDAIFSNETQWASIQTAPLYVFPYLLKSKDRTFVEKYTELWDMVKEEKIIPAYRDSILNWAKTQEARDVDASRIYDYAKWPISQKTVQEDIDKAVAWFDVREEMIDSLMKTLTPTPTGIMEVKKNITPSDEYIYTLSGQRVNKGLVDSHDGRGIFIIQGKKIMK